MVGHGFIPGRRTKAISVHKTDFWYFIPGNGYSGAIDWEQQLYDTTDGEWHSTAYEDTGTATGTQTTSTLQDTTKSWTVNDYAGAWVWIDTGTGQYQRKKIVSNTSTTLTISGTWTTTPDATSTYKIYFNSRITVDEDGIYEVSIQVGWEKGMDIRGILVFVNNAFSTYFVKFSQAKSADTENAMHTCKKIQLSAGDYIEVQLYQSSGVDKRFVGQTSRTWFQVEKID